jgi:hypothetical protein
MVIRVRAEVDLPLPSPPLGNEELPLERVD